MAVCMQNFLKYTVNVDIAKYSNGVRETLNPEGRAHAHVVWDFFHVCLLCVRVLGVCSSLVDAARELGAHAQPPDLPHPPVASQCSPAGLLHIHGRIKHVSLDLLDLHTGVHALRRPCRYLTPAGSQGFAPHYDDIEVSVFLCTFIE